MTKKQIQEQEQNEAIEQLRKWCPPGTEIKCVLRHRSRSGMMRVISFFAQVDGELLDITNSVGLACGISLDRNRWGLRVHG